MSKRAKAASPPSAPPAGPAVSPPGPASLAGLVALGFVSSLWALVLWGELVLARQGGTPFCAVGTRTDCTALWDSAFASGVHRLTGLPVAAWGLAWGLGAFVLPLLVLERRARGEAAPAFVTAIRVLAVIGIVVVFTLLGVAASERAFCLGCLGSYLLVGGYAGIALLGWSRTGFVEAPRGAALAFSAIALAFLVLLYPGLHTPRNAVAAGRAAVSDAKGGAPSADADGKLRDFVGSLRPDLRQTLSDSLGIYRSSPVIPLPAPRAVVGPASAPVRITEFTDVLCSHCAELHETLDALRASLPAGSFSVEPRQFPLDAACNPMMRGKSDPVRCLAAKARICLEGKEGASAFGAALFQNQKGLTTEQVFSLAAPYMPRSSLEACVNSPAAAGRLADDIALASQTDADGTPIVLVNGRRGTSFGPFLFAMVLSRGDAENPAFAGLPPANPSAHLH
jgi:predicted DsbA family dithiol-disulfide isomerase